MKAVFVNRVFGDCLCIVVGSTIESVSKIRPWLVFLFVGNSLVIGLCSFLRLFPNLGFLFEVFLSELFLLCSMFSWSVIKFRASRC